MPPRPGTVLPHRRLRPCVVRGWSTSAAVRRHQNAVRSTDSYTAIGASNFAVAGPRVWNSLLPELRMLKRVVTLFWIYRRYINKSIYLSIYCLHLAAKLKTFLFSAVSASENFWSHAIVGLLSAHYITLHYVVVVQNPDCLLSVCSESGGFWERVECARWLCVEALMCKAIKFSAAHNDTLPVARRDAAWRRPLSPHSTSRNCCKIQLETRVANWLGN